VAQSVKCLDFGSGRDLRVMIEPRVGPSSDCGVCLRLPLTVLVHLGYHNKATISLGGSDNTHLFLIVLEAGQSKIKVPAESSLGFL